MSTDPEALDALKTGILCYLHLWASLRKHLNAAHGDIARDIGLWSDEMGSYFAAYNPGNRRMLQIGKTYVCAFGEDGPVVGQLDRVPPCTPVILSSDVLMLLDALAGTGGEDVEKALAQVDMVCAMIAKNLPAPLPRKAAH